MNLNEYNANKGDEELVINKIVNLGQYYYGVNDSNEENKFYQISIDGDKLMFSEIPEDRIPDFNERRRASLETILNICENESDEKVNSRIYLNFKNDVPLVSGSMPYCSEMKQFLKEPLYQMF